MNKDDQLERALRRKNYTFSEIKTEFGITKKEAITLMDKFKANGVGVKSFLDEQYTNHFYIPKQDLSIKNLELMLADGDYCAGLCSDIHVGDAAFMEAELNDYYDKCDDAGVNCILNAGDICTGVTVYRGQQADLLIHTKMEQTDYVIDKLPTLANDKKTYFVTGNHDLKNLESSFDPGIIIGSKKKGWEYLGQYLADVKMASGLKIRLNHLSGHPYSLSYHSQKYVRELTPDNMPDILLLGHAHRLLYMVLQGINVFEGGCFQGENNFSKHHGLENSVGAWIINYTINNGKLERLRPELLLYKD